METKANYVAVGAFTLLVLALCFAFIYWLGRYGDDNNLVAMDIRIEGSATGLDRGSEVKFNGIRIGTVEKLELDQASPSVVIARTKVRSDIPIKKDTVASLGIPGLTGQAFIELQGGTASAPSVIAQAIENGTTPQINADPSAVNNLLATAKDITNRADRILTVFEKLVDENAGSVGNTIKNVETFSTALAENRDGIDKFLVGVTDLAESMDGLSQKLDGTIGATEKIVKAIDPESVGQSVENANKAIANIAEFSTSLSSLGKDIQTVAPLISKTANELSVFSTGANRVLLSVDQLMTSLDPKAISKAVTNVGDAADGVRTAMVDVNTMTKDVMKTTKVIGDRSEDVDQIIANTRELTNKLGKASQGVSDFLDAVDPKVIGDAVNNVGEAATSIRKISEDIAKTSDVIGKRSHDVDLIIQNARDLTTKLNETTSTVREFVDALDPKVIGTAVENVGQAAASLKDVSQNISKTSEVIGARSGEVDSIIVNVTEMAQRLNGASVRVNSLMTKLDGFLGAGDGPGVVADAQATLKEFRRLAVTLQSRVNEISANVNRFSKSGLSDVQALVQDSRRSINRIERVISNFERNPAGFIGGRSNVREFNGRPRR